MNEEKIEVGNLEEEDCFGFPGFEFRLNTNRTEETQGNGERVKAVLKANWSKPLSEVIRSVNAVIQGWVNYFRIGNSNSAFKKVRNDIEKKVRKFVMKRQKQKGYGWKAVE